MTDAVTAAIKEWGGWVLGAIAFIGTLWNRIGIVHLDVRTDGLKVEYDKMARRADRAEATVDEKNDARDRAEKERDRRQ
jgi:hypothetical protein